MSGACINGINTFHKHVLVGLKYSTRDFETLFSACIVVNTCAGKEVIPKGAVQNYKPFYNDC